MSRSHAEGDSTQRSKEISGELSHTMTSLFSNAPLNDSSKNTIIKFNEKEVSLCHPEARFDSVLSHPFILCTHAQDDKLIRADDMLALVGADQSLSRDLSGSSFSMLLSEELSQGELLRAMSTLQDDLFRSTPPLLLAGLSTAVDHPVASTSPAPARCRVARHTRCRTA